MSSQISNSDVCSAAVALKAKEEELMRLTKLCILCEKHACQCRNSNCRLSCCQKMKEDISHIKTCKEKSNGNCKTCKRLILLNCYHAQNCQQTECPVLFCLTIQYKLRQKRMTIAEIMEGGIAGLKETIKQSCPGTSNPTNQPHASQPGIGMTPAACSSVGDLQTVHQVQAATARQTEPQMLPISRQVEQGNSTILNNPTTSTALMRAQHIQKPTAQMLSGASNRMMGMGNMTNRNSSNVTQNMTLQATQPGQEMGLRPRSQMVGAMPNTARTVSVTIGLPGVLGNSETLTATMQTGSTRTFYFPRHKQQVLQISTSNPQPTATFNKRRSSHPRVVQQSHQVMKERPVIRQPQPHVWKQQKQQQQREKLQQLLAIQRQQLKQQQHLLSMQS